MNIKELNKEQLQQVKQRHYAEKEDRDISYEEIVNIDELVADEEIYQEYGNVEFTEDDFF